MDPRITIIFLILSASHIEGSNILAMMAAPLASQVKGFLPFFVELAKRGHNVTIYTPFAVENPPENYHQVIVKNIAPELNFDMKRFFTTDWSFVTLPFSSWSFAIGITELVFQQPEIQNLLLSEDTKFDLIFLNNFYQDSFMYFAHKFQVPVIQFIPFGPLHYANHYAGNPVSCSSIPDIRLGFPLHMTLTQRLKNCIFAFFDIYVAKWIYLPKLEKIVDKHYVGNKPPLSELLRNVSLSLIHSDHILFHPKPYVPSFVEVSGFHIGPLKTLPQNLQEIMDNSTQGVIYLSFGSWVSVAHLPPGKVDILLEVFSKIPHTVLWKFDADVPPKLPQNVIVMKWFPQMEILAHPNLKLFMTHGGLHSLLETIHCGVPVLGFPFFADQISNMMSAEMHGYGKIVDYKTITVDSLLKDLQSALHPRYLEKAKSLSFIYKDRQLPPMETAVYWTEHVLRHNGSIHLRSPQVNLRWYQIFLLDAIALFLLLPICTVVAIYYLSKILTTHKYNNLSINKKKL